MAIVSSLYDCMQAAAEKGKILMMTMLHYRPEPVRLDFGVRNADLMNTGGFDVS